MSGRRITVIDHGTGNLFSVARAIEHVGAEPEFVSTPEGVLGGERLILPGVGAFGLCMQGLYRLNLVEAIREAARSRPIFGICVGMQMLFDGGLELGRHEGLGLVPGWVKRLPETDDGGNRIKIPHIGWNSLLPAKDGQRWEGGVLGDLAPGEPVYFVHSYAPEPAERSDRLAEVDYGGNRFCVAVQRENVLGTQFHPERSGPAGLSILRAFVRN